MFCEAKNEVIEYYEEEPIRADTRSVLGVVAVVVVDIVVVVIEYYEEEPIRADTRSVLRVVDPVVVVDIVVVVIVVVL